MTKPSSDRIVKEASDRENDANARRYEHGNAARTWDAVASFESERAELCEILARWMAAYEAADAQAEQEFRALGARLKEGQ